VRRPAARRTHWTFYVKNAGWDSHFRQNGTINTLFPVVSFLKCVVTEIVSFSIVAFKTLTFHKVVWRHTWGVVGSLVTVLLQMISWFRWWNKFENRSIFAEVKAYEVKAYKKFAILGHPVDISAELQNWILFQDCWYIYMVPKN